MIKDIVDSVKELDLSEHKPEVLNDKNSPDGTYKKNLDSSKINYFGWYPNINFNDGLKKVILRRKN